MQMDVLIEKVFPIIMIFICGYLLKYFKVLNINEGETFLKLFIYVSLPCLIFLSVAQMNLSYKLLWLPIVSMMIIFITFIVSYLTGKWLKLKKPTFGVFLVGSLIMNTGFIYPFLIATKGEESLALASLFDFGNTALVFTFVYYLACKYGSNSCDLIGMTKKFASFPPLIALILGLFVNMNHMVVPDMVAKFFIIIGYMAIPLMMLSLGVFFNPKAVRIFPVLLVLFIRMGFGFALGWFFVYIFKFEGLTKMVVLICSSAPTGINTLVFSYMEKLDNEFAANVVSYSVVTGMILVPLLIQFIS
jgi:malate permease and related proteins